MGWDTCLSETRCEKKEGVSSYINMKSLTPLSRAICGLLDILPVAQDTLIVLLREQGFKETVAAVFQELVELELKGMIERVGGQYKLKDEIVLKH